jgi:hypothetical protein
LKAANLFKTMVSQVILTASSGAWMNRDLYTIQSVDSSAEKSYASGEEQHREGRVRVPSDGDAGALPSLLGIDADTSDEQDIMKFPSKGESEVETTYRSENKSTDTDLDYVNGWSTGTDLSSIDSQDEIFVVKRKLSVNVQDNGGENRSDCIILAETEGESTLQASQPEMVDSTESPTSTSSSDESSASQTDSSDSISGSSNSHKTVYTSDGSSTYISDKHHLIVTMQRKEVDLDSTPAGVLALRRRSSLTNGEDESSRILPLTLDNVEYMSTFDQASTDTDLSTIDEPISKEAAMRVFFCRTNIPNLVPVDMQSEISSICTKRKLNVTFEESPEDLEVGVVSQPTTTASINERITTIFQAFFAERSTMETFFLCLILTSSLTLLILLVVLVANL